MNKISLQYLLLFLLFFHCVLSINIEYENTWTRYTNYKNGIEQFDNKMYVNSYCAVEIYDVFQNGDLEFYSAIEYNGLVKNLQIDRPDSMLYVYVADYLESGGSYFYSYRLTHYELQPIIEIFSPDRENYTEDLIFPVDDYVILGQTSSFPCFNKETQQLEDINFPYNKILGSYNDILVEYDFDDTLMSFYKIDDINNPELLYSNIHSLYLQYNGSSCLLNETFFALIDGIQVLIFNVEEDDNIYLETIWTSEVCNHFEHFEIIDDNIIYFALDGAYNYVFDISNISEPQLICSWTEDDMSLMDYHLNNNGYLYRTENLKGIWKYDLSSLPPSGYETFGSPYMYLSTSYFDGNIYKIYDSTLYELNIEMNQENMICSLNYSIGYDFYKHDNLLLISFENFYNNTYQCQIINLDDNEFVADIPISGEIYCFQNSVAFIDNYNTIDVFQLNNSNSFDYVTNFPYSSLYLVNELDSSHVFFSGDSGDFLYNTQTLEIEYDYGNSLSSGYNRYANSLFYNNRLLITDYSPGTNSSIVNLYELNTFDNPILLDSKDEEYIAKYALIENFLIEYSGLQVTKIYEPFDNEFSNEIEIYDFDTFLTNLKIDEERERILNTNSFYNFRSFLYNITESGIDIFPEHSINLDNIPNPFNPSTLIKFNLPYDSYVDLSVYNLKGEKVLTLIDKPLNKGEQSVFWDGADSSGKLLSSGIYFCKLETGNLESCSKMILLK